MLTVLLLLTQLGTGFGTCPKDAHRHEVELGSDGQPTIYQFDNKFRTTKGQPPQPDIVMDGLCHDNDTEVVCSEKRTDSCMDASREVLPVPSQDDGEI